MNGIKFPSIPPLLTTPSLSNVSGAVNSTVQPNITSTENNAASSSTVDPDPIDLWTPSRGLRNRHKQMSPYRRGQHKKKPTKKTSKQHSLITTDGIDLGYTAKKTAARDIVIEGMLIRVWHPHAEHSEDVMRSFKNLARYPDVYPYIAVMPDFHIGESAVNGVIIPSLNTLYVNAIGGDIGCGMASMRLPLKRDDIAAQLQDIYKEIYRRVPVGRRTHTDIDERIAAHPIFKTGLEVMSNATTRRAMQQMGTLGSGNHFVEIQETDEGEINVMVHTGSRILGQNIRKMGIQMGEQSQRPHGLVSIKADSDNGHTYMEHTSLATAYARANRREILRQVFEAFKQFIPQLGETSFAEVAGGLIDVPHNYIAREHHFGKDVYVHRKGAVHVPSGSLGLIPGSMGTSSYIVRGKGNAFSFNSSSHGAGRRMSRGEAFKRIHREAYRTAMKGILSRDDDSIVDEAPQAYKDIDEIVRLQKDLVHKVERLHPLASIKG